MAKWENDLVEVIRVKGKQSLYNYVVRCKERTSKNQIILVHPDTTVDGIIFENYLNKQHCPLRDGFLKTDLPNTEQKKQFPFQSDLISYRVRWLK